MAIARPSSPRAAFAVRYLVLFATAWLVYSPALNRLFATDQIWYFAELHGKTSLVDGLRLYDYGATRQFWKGDEALFRPLLFTWLAIENTLLTFHHVWWNIANLVLHAAVATLLLQLLLAIHRSIASCGFALLFVVMKPPMELVVWNHLGGYLWACVFTLIGLHAVFDVVRDASAGGVRSPLVRFAWAFTLANLFYEAMVPLSLLGGALAAVHLRRRRPLKRFEIGALAAPVLIFCSFYALHAARVARLGYVDVRGGSILSPFNLLMLVPNCVRAIGSWIVQLALPAAVRLAPAAFVRTEKTFRPASFSTIEAVDGAIALGMLIVLFYVVGGPRRSSTRSWSWLLLGGLFSYAAVICLGRPMHEVIASSYYLYVPAFLTLLLVYSWIAFDRVRGWKAVVGGALLVAFIALNAIETRAVSQAIGRVNDEPSRLFNRIGRFVDAHKNEPDFSFAILSHPEGLDPEIVLRVGYPDDPASTVRRVRISEVIFGRYYDAVRPKYLFDRSSSQ